jgi:hypothetical protein
LMINGSSSTRRQEMRAHRTSWQCNLLYWFWWSKIDGRLMYLCFCVPTAISPVTLHDMTVSTQQPTSITVKEECPEGRRRRESTTGNSKRRTLEQWTPKETDSFITANSCGIGRNTTCSRKVWSNVRWHRSTRGKTQDGYQGPHNLKKKGLRC